MLFYFGAQDENVIYRRCIFRCFCPIGEFNFENVGVMCGKRRQPHKITQQQQKKTRIETKSTEQTTMSKRNLNCRFYEQKYPENDDLVMVRVKSISEIGAYVSLLEYDNIEGLILSGELSRKRIRSVSQLIRVGRQETVVVLRVDTEKGKFFLVAVVVWSVKILTFDPVVCGDPN